MIGIGVNCASAPEGLAYKATSLAEIGAAHDARDIFPPLSDEMIDALDRFAGGSGFGAIREEWLSFAAGLGAPIRVETPSGAREGLFRTIDASGRLILECNDGTKTIEAGDVWFPEAAAGAMR